MSFNVRIHALEAGDASDKTKVLRYAAKSNKNCPPIYVVGRRALDGLHRVAAAKLRGETVITAEGCPSGITRVKKST